MLPVIEKLLVLQDRDLRLQRSKQELENIAPERAMLDEKGKAGQSGLEAAKLKSREIEAERKRLELEVVSKKQQIDKYSIQQFQTKKNEEYQALAHEIIACKKAIEQLDDQQLVQMEAAEGAAKEQQAAAKAAAEIQAIAVEQMKALADREVRLKKQLAELEQGYAELEAAVEPDALSRYLRLRKTKGGSAVVGIAHGVCGGCHMKLPQQVINSCRAQSDVVTCSNCGRIVYYTRDMDLAVVD